MLQFQPVRCPVCEGVVMEIAKGLARGRCRNRDCAKKPRVWAACDGKALTVGIVDTAPRRLLRQAQDEQVVA